MNMDICIFDYFSKISRKLCQVFQFTAVFRFSISTDDGDIAEYFQKRNPINGFDEI